MRQEIQARMQRQINHWSRQYEELKHKDTAGKRTRLPAHVAKERAELLVSRLGKRMAALDWGRPGFGSTGSNFSLAQLLSVAEGPH